MCLLNEAISGLPYLLDSSGDLCSLTEANTS